MKLLLVDNSNTRTKFTIAETGKELSGTFWIPTNEISEASLSEKLAPNSFDAALICSVVPEKRAILEDHLGALVPIHRLTHESPLGLEIDYPNPSSIGADRLANAVGVVARHGSPAVVIDFGTAVTFDVISATPAYCGGVIAPGLGAMSEYLGRRTALLPAFEMAEPPSAIGKSTSGAMQSGAVIGYRGLVKEILLEIRRELNDSPCTVATGGDAALIARGVSEIEHVDPDLTLHGLRLVAETVFL